MSASQGYVPAADGVRLFFRKLGDGPNAVIIPNAVHMFDSFQHLAGRHTVIFFDFRNRGRSEAASDPAQLTMPVTIHGTRDRQSPYGGGIDWVSSLPDARLLTVPNAAHVPWIEAPEKVFGAIQTFLAGRWPDEAEAPGSRRIA